MTMNTWSKTASSNSTADGTINWAEGQAPSSVNDSARAMMAAVAKFRDDNSGSLVTGGTSTAYTITSNQVFASLSAMSGASLRIKFNATNGAAPTLNVDGLGAKAIQTVAGTTVGTGQIRANAIYDLVYDNANTCWVLVGSPPDALTAPQGTVMLFQQTAAPTGWTKSVTHNDKALRIVSGTASSGGSTAFTSVFAARTIAQANLPNVSLSGSLTAHTVDNGSTASRQNGTGGFINMDSLDAGTVNRPLVVDSLSVSLGGSGTALDFAVQYVDCIAASKD